ncbi:unnamed protein product [Rotaria magnacalcarata]|uniref:Uncharacterized protein n=1 Tax=Rotaria magnacalcarata TaxID=392030 RepID=A0A816ZKR1_9BILA|nr:unnamed protein product [Rotaria magnacalcarata]
MTILKLNTIRLKLISIIQTEFQISDRNGSSGIRFYLGDQLRQYDIGYLTFGTDQSSAWDGMGRKKSSHGTSEMSNLF